MRAFDYSRTETVEEAIALLRPDDGPEAGPHPSLHAGETRLLAGGTDLLTLMKADLAAPSRLVPLKHLEELPRGIRETADGIEIGALTTLTEIERSPLLRERCPVLPEAAEVAATPQLRNMATLGGNLLQRPRCWYFRNSLFHCWLKGGDHCPARDGENQFHALFGEGPCCAVHPSDPAPALLSLDADVRLRGATGERTVPLSDFYAVPHAGRRSETTIGGDEVILSVRIPTPAEGTRSTYLKAMDRKVWAFALVSVAAVLRMDAAGRRIEDARLVLGGVAPIPWRVHAAEELLSAGEPSDELFNRVAEVAVAGARPLSHNRYKVPLLTSLIRRALSALAPGPGDGSSSTPSTNSG